ncbi:hypothetical protein HUJ05_005693 [Dendroctonus ponderosae]|nr:hypothetical protein HUJ05_005693 [Dendroctonus ponderosae]
MRFSLIFQLGLCAALSKETQFERVVLSANFSPQSSRDFPQENPGRKCLGNLTKCPETDGADQQTSERLLQWLTAPQPPFNLGEVRLGVSVACQRDSQKYMSELRLLKMWALKSEQKLGEILASSIIQHPFPFMTYRRLLGDFDMCLSALSEDGVQGQYCLAAIEVQTPHSPHLAALHKLAHSHYHFRSRLEDPGHRVPRFSSINWALCVPSSCSANDVSIGLRPILEAISNDTSLEFRHQVSPLMCQMFASIYDNVAVGDKNKWLTSFSLPRNACSLLGAGRAAGDIPAIHGIRMFNALLLLTAHKSMAVLFLPFANRTEAIEYLGRPYSVLGRAASLYTDPFIMISGLLTAHSLLGKLERNGRINVIQEYVSRLYRIVPTFAALIAFCTFVLPWLNGGPLWNQVVTHHSDICKQYWWRNLLFIHNYFGFKDMCLTHTHHLGIDTQLFLISPLWVYGLWRWPKRGAVALGLLASLSTAARYYVTFSRSLSNYVHFGTSVQQLFATADFMYILPPHRATVYIMGIFMGALLRRAGNFELSTVQIRLGNALAVCSLLVAYLGPSFMSNLDYVYNPHHAALYAAFSPILWVGSFCWLIYSSQKGHNGFIGRLFAHPVNALWTKISYTVYLTQFPVFFYNVGVTRTSREFGFFTQIFNLQEYAWIGALSVLMTLCVEMPFQNLRTLMVKRSAHGAQVVKKTS